MLIRIHLILYPHSFYTKAKTREGGKDQIERDLNRDKFDNAPSLTCHANTSTVSSLSSNKTIASALNTKDDASSHCADALAYAWVERPISRQENNPTADSDVDDDDQKKHLVSIKEDMNSIVPFTQQEDWFKGTLFYQDPHMPPPPPPKDYISVHFYFEQDDTDSLYWNQKHHARPSQSIYSVSSRMGASLHSGRKSIAGKVKSVIRRRSSHA
ncbi:hypothetical protein BC941DRAFT_428927 [Chlamydoabsidia padenii]|nr:hypothetical protein BC941DRAFT_428927 [Chlamydoabsidia padenii]